MKNFEILDVQQLLVNHDENQLITLVYTPLQINRGHWTMLKEKNFEILDITYESRRKIKLFKSQLPIILNFISQCFIQSQPWIANNCERKVKLALKIESEDRRGEKVFCIIEIGIFTNSSPS